MNKKLLLISYPTLAQVAEQLSMPSESNRFGEYIGQIPNTTIVDSAVRDISEVYQVLLIAPERMERVASDLGRIIIKGITSEGESATVDIDPFCELNTLGTIFVGEQVNPGS